MPRDLLGGAAVFRFIAERTCADAVEDARSETLAGGAVLRHDRLDFILRGGRMPGRQSWVLRRDAATKLGIGLSRAREFALQRALFRAGLPVAEPLFACCEETVLGAPFYLMRRVGGVADGMAITQAGENAPVAAALARELARLQKLTPRPGILGLPPQDPVAVRLYELEAALNADDDPLPVARWALRWLRSRPPSPLAPVLCHGDFRTGNYLVEEGQLAGILDWDFAQWGDPDEDIAWFCSRHWRFAASTREAGGVAPGAVFRAAYEAAAGRRLDPERLRYWSVMASLRWLLIALRQRDRFLEQGEASLDLALTGRRVAECEHEILALTGAGEVPALSALALGAHQRASGNGASPNAFRDRPSGEELMALVGCVGGGGPLAARAVAIAARERAADASAFAACRAMLAARYGAAEDRALLAQFSAEIRAGVFDHGTACDGARAVMAAITRQKLIESNPDFLAGGGER